MFSSSQPAAKPGGIPPSVIIFINSLLSSCLYVHHALGMFVQELLVA